MSIIRNRIVLLLILCNSACLLFAQETVPRVESHPRPLTDVYLFLSGQTDFSTGVQSLTTNRDRIISPGAMAGVGLGFHMPYSNQSMILRTGYRYMNHSYVGSHYPGGMSTHWLNIDLRYNVSWYSFAGVQTDVLLSRSLPSVPWDCMGFDISCYNPATCSVYLGTSFEPVPNLSVDCRMGYAVIGPFNKKATGYRMMSVPGGAMWLELGLSYRVFTTGQRKK